MNVETYRYLISSLIQVFGALIALDLFVLVIRYQDILNRLDLAAFQVGKVLSMIKNYKRLLHYKTDGMEFEYVSSDASMFQSFNINKRNDMIKEVEENLLRWVADLEKERDKGNATGAGSLREYGVAKNALIEKKMHYQTLSDEMKSIPTLAIKLMAFPAGTVVVFSILLIHADWFSKATLYWMAWGTVITSGIVLSLLVKWAWGLFLQSKE